VKPDYDILIVGGGMVGMSLACALSPLPLRVGIIERFALKSTQQSSFDDRSIALAYGTRKIFQTMGIWDVLDSVVMPIKKIHISERGQFGVTRLNAHDQGVDALGYVVESRVLGQVLQHRLETETQAKMICPADVLQVDVGDDVATVKIEHEGQEQTLTASLIVAADGSQSVIRDQLSIQTETREYGQTALISNVSTSIDHNNMAYERFTDTGPLALLPMRPVEDQGEQHNRCSLVWTLNNDQVDEYMGLSDEEFLTRLQQRFGRRLGQFVHVGQRSSYPLSLIRVPESIQSRVALIGNAAHTLHPVAGQGYNLGMRDVAVLAEVIASAVKAKSDIGDLQVLQHYAEWRRSDHNSVIAFTDGLVRIFTNPLFPVKFVRSAALTLLDLVPALKQGMARRTMGLAGRIPGLARGIPIK